MRNSTLLLTSALLFAAGLSGQAEAQQQAALPKADGKTKQWLEDRLGKVIESCLVGQARIKMKRAVGGSKIASPIPKDLIDYACVPGNDEYWQLGPTGAVRQFGLVLSKEDVEAGRIPTAVERSLSTDLLGPSRDLLLRGNVNFQTYEQSCATAFSTAISAGGGLDSGTISAAGEAATTASGYKRADVAAGTFISPFTSAWNGPQSTTAQKVYVALLFWDWRRRNQNGDGYLIRQFDGYALKTATNKKFNLSASGSTSGGFALPFLSIKAKVDGEYSDATAFESELFEAIATKPIGRTVSDYFVIPSENDINAIILTNGDIRVSHADDGVLVGGLRQTSYIDVANVPSIFCRSRADYEVIGASAAQMTIDSVVDKNEEGYCRFAVTYRPSQTSGIGSVDVPFAIHFKKAGLPNGMTGFEIPVTGLQYQWANVPKLQPNANLLTLFARQDLSEGIETLIWRATGFIDDRNLLSPGYVSVTNAKLQDGCNVPRLVSGTDATMQLSNRQAGKLDYVLTISMRFSKDNANNLQAPGARTQDCGLSATLLYDVSGNRQITRPLGDAVILRLPAAPPAAAELSSAFAGVR